MHIPADIIRYIAATLAEEGQQRTLANLSAASWEAYEVCTPALYAALEVGAHGAARLLHLTPRDVAGFPGFVGGECLGWDEDPRRRMVARRLAALAHVKHITVRSLPPDHLAEDFAAAAKALASSSPPVLLFPRLRSMSLLPQTVDGLREWTQETFDGWKNPPLLEALSLGARPTHCCIAFRLVPSSSWEVHRETTSAGQYRLVRKVALLVERWHLESIIFHDIVHQVPPSVPSTTNVYEFAPHVVPHPLFARRYKFPTGAAAVTLPGPEWNLRPWQIGLAVKNLCSSLREEVPEDARWVFCGITNHILTKAERDDDDSTGVWYAEVDEMVRDSVRMGLERDLPARGVSAEMLVDMWGRIEFRKDAGECPACHRGIGGYPVMPLQ